MTGWWYNATREICSVREWLTVISLSAPFLPAQARTHVSEETPMAEATLEQRLTAPEQQVAALLDRESMPGSKGNWLARVKGSQKGEPDFEDVLELGREVRQADRPSE